ncbi:MAG: YceI family protein [Bacteroidia bacterium]|jgi:hypothetical protein
MKSILLSFALVLATFSGVRAQLYSTQSGKLSFFSTTPVEDISAHSEKCLAVLSVEKREMAFSVSNPSFEFKNKLMQEHFNEKYIESEKYPNSTFKCKINEQIDLTKDGEYPVTVTGKLNVHGVERERVINGVITVKDKKITIKAEFKVMVADHKITIPKLVIANIAEEITVKIDAVLMMKQ